MELVRYDAACRAVAEAKTIDEVKEIQNRAEAVRAYARQAKNKQLELDAMEIRVRAERKGGELLIGMKGSNVLRVQGVRDHTDRGSRLLKLADLGIDGDDAGTFQRLAKIPEDRFEQEIKEWRQHSESISRREMPLQRYRRPTIVGDRQKAAHRGAVRHIDPADVLDKFKAPDGRRISDWRAGELERIEQLAFRVLHCVDALFAEMPVANPEPLDTMEMIFEKATLVALLDEIWRAPITLGNNGINGSRIERAREARAAKYKRVCKRCGSAFIMHRPSGKAMSGRSNEGQFCSRSCSHNHRKVGT